MCHLYLFGIDGKLVRPLTEGDWMVEDIKVTISDLLCDKHLHASIL